MFETYGMLETSIVAMQARAAGTLRITVFLEDASDEKLKPSGNLVSFI